MGADPQGDKPRKPLARHKPLKAKKSFARKREAAPQARRSTGPSPDTRVAVWGRCGDRCERCGVSLAGTAVSLHHRKPRRAGGTKDPAVNRASNLMYVCGSGTTGCHGWIESHRKDAYAHGWLLGSHENPARTPVYVWGRGPVLLTDDGRYQLILSAE